MLSTPELVLHKGKTGIVKNAIVFKNGNYPYIVPEYRCGVGNDFGKVIIKHKDKVIVDQRYNFFHLMIYPGRVSTPYSKTIRL